MASNDTSTDLTDAAYLLDVISTLPEFRVEWKDIAKVHGVHHTTAPRRFRTIAKRHGYTYENNKVTKDDGGGTVETTPKKGRAKRAANPKATPAKKKAKLSVKDEDEAEETGEDVKDTSTGGEAKFENAAGDEEIAGTNDSAGKEPGVGSIKEIADDLV